jgi:hypothetical protein
LLGAIGRVADKQFETAANLSHPRVAGYGASRPVDPVERCGQFDQPATNAQEIAIQRL